MITDANRPAPTSAAWCGARLEARAGPRGPERRRAKLVTKFKLMTPKFDFYRSPPLSSYLVCERDNS
jgi:hypothetical protein